MSSKPDGGPAFPTTEFYDEQPIGSYGGMTLRQYYVGQALSGLSANPDCAKSCLKELQLETYIARIAVMYADEAIKAEGEE